MILINKFVLTISFSHIVRLVAQALLAIFFLTSSYAYAARQALVIGNDQYAAISKLDNAAADAELIGQTLQKAGYKTTILKNLTLRAFQGQLRIFKSQIRAGDEIVFFYAGHGVQIGAMNYLLPIDVRGDNEEALKDDAIPLTRIMEELREAKAKFSLAIIDAC